VATPAAEVSRGDGHQAAGQELSRRLLPAGVAAGTVSIAVLALVLYADRSRLWSMIDLRVYDWGGRLAFTDANVYHRKFHGFLFFTYTPMALTLCMAASLVKVGVAKWLITIATIVSVGLSAWLALGIGGYRRSSGRLGLALLVGAVALWLEPVQQTLSFGQVNALLMAVVLADLALPRSCRLKGIGIGLAAGFKLVPGIFIGYLLVTRQWRAAAVAIGTFALTVLYPFAVLPVPSRQYWLGGLFDKTSRVGSVTYVANQSLYGMITRFMRTVGPAMRPPWLACAIVVLVAGLFLAAWAERQGERLLAVVATAVTGLLVSPVSWSHHWVWVTVIGVALIDLVLRYRSSVAFAATVASFLVWFAYPVREGSQVVPEGLIWGVPNTHHREWHWHGYQLFIGNLYVFTGLALLAGLACYLAVLKRAAAVPAPPSPAVPQTVT
jgi:alpha-1,2-mannosyltransferase